MIIKAKSSDTVFRACLTKAAVPVGLMASFVYDDHTGDYLQLDMPGPVCLNQAFTPTQDPTKALRKQLDEIHARSASSGLVGRIPVGRWFFVNWDLDFDNSNKHGAELAASLRELNSTLDRQRAESSAELAPFPRSEVEQLLTLRFFEDYEFTPEEATELASDLETMYDKAIADDSYHALRKAIESGRVNGNLADALVQLDPAFLKPQTDYPWARSVIAEYLATPTKPPGGFLRRLFAR